MIGYRTIDIYPIFICISALNIGLKASFGQSSIISPTFISFEEKFQLFVSSFFSLFFHWSPFEWYIYRNGPKQAQLPKRTGLAAVHSCNSWVSPVKRISIPCYGTVLNIFVYIWLVLGVFLLFLFPIQPEHTV